MISYQFILMLEDRKIVASVDVIDVIYRYNMRNKKSR